MCSKSLHPARGYSGSGIAFTSRPGHLGIVGMRERALEIDARFALESTPGDGTTVRLEWSAAR